MLLQYLKSCNMHPYLGEVHKKEIIQQWDSWWSLHKILPSKTLILATFGYCCNFIQVHTIHEDFDKNLNDGESFRTCKQLIYMFKFGRLSFAWSTESGFGFTFSHFIKEELLWLKSISIKLLK